MTLHVSEMKVPPLVDMQGHTLKVGEEAFFFLGDHPSLGGKVKGKVTAITEDRVEVGNASIPRWAIVRFTVIRRKWDDMA